MTFPTTKIDPKFFDKVLAASEEDPNARMDYINSLGDALQSCPNILMLLATKCRDKNEFHNCMTCLSMGFEFGATYELNLNTED